MLTNKIGSGIVRHNRLHSTNFNCRLQHIIHPRPHVRVQRLAESYKAPLVTLQQKIDLFADQVFAQPTVPLLAHRVNMHVTIRRNSILPDIVNFISTKSVHELIHARLAITFEGEAGVDCDGLGRELCDLVAEALVARYLPLPDNTAAAAAITTTASPLSPALSAARPLFLQCPSGYCIPHPFADRIPFNPTIFRYI
jgi:hypothetical protein